MSGFNLFYDRGKMLELKTGDNVEAILIVAAPCSGDTVEVLRSHLLDCGE
jgi:coproporphyrinogen III oxidase